MPITFHYVQQESPPAPYVLVSIGRFNGQASLADLSAKVDSGADRTVLPLPVVTQLALDEIEQRSFAGLGSVVTTLSIYRAVLIRPHLARLGLAGPPDDGAHPADAGHDVLDLLSA